MKSNNFIEDALKAFKSIIEEIEKGSSEHDVRYRFVKYLLEDVLAYEPKYIKWEKKRADLTIVDENDFAVIKIETKRPTENIDKTKYEEQAFKYEEEATRYIGLTNFLRFKLWEVKKERKELKVDLDFSKILEKKSQGKQLSTEEKAQILFLNNLTKKTLFDPSKYEIFDENYARIDITKEAGFKKLLDRLNYIVNDLLLSYTLMTFEDYKDGYNKYQVELYKLERESKNKKGNNELNYNLVKYRQKLEDKYKKYTSFSGFGLWKEYSGKEKDPDDVVKETFCKESIYVLLNKLLFIRICEDKNLLPKNISNGGIEVLRQRTIHEDIVYKEVLEWAFSQAYHLYPHFYETGILDWFRAGDGELNRLLNRILWILNQFDFAHVDRDILGNLYEKYLPSGERKKLGEFYTPVEVIDYILTSVGYTYSHDIENKDLLDPACGSGGFLVRATRRLISRFLMKFGKANKKELREPKNWRQVVGRLTPDESKIILDAIKEHIFGLDINPFACHIAEMNMLFQIVDLYQKVREKYRDYELGRFKIYRTDSLELPIQRKILDYGYAAFLEEQEEINKIKSKKFDFVVGNPPYVRQEQIGVEYKNKKIKRDYNNVYDGRADLYVYFIERGIRWLNTDAKLGYITSNKFINANYGKKLRKFLLNNVNINNIIDFGDLKIFKDARNYTCIITFDKHKKTDNKIKMIKVKDAIIRLNNPIFHIYKKFTNKFYNDQFLQVFEVEQNDLSEDKWALFPSSLKKIKDKVNSTSNFKLKDCCNNMAGMRTGLNKAFIIDLKTINHFRIEKYVYKKCLRGKDIKKFKIIFRNNFVLYTNNIDLNDYPNTKAYINKFKAQLSNRAQFKSRTDMQWYEIEQPVSKEIFESKKIITPAMSNTSNFVFDDEGYYCLDSCYLVIIKPDFEDKLNYHYLLGLLNSNILEFYLKQTSPFVRGRWYSYKKQYTDLLPIKIPETTKEKQITNQIIEKVDEILELNKKTKPLDIKKLLRNQETEKLYNLSSVTFSIRDNAKFKKLKVNKDKIFINSTDFIEIKDKKILDFVLVYLNLATEELKKDKDVKSSIYEINVPKYDSVLDNIIEMGKLDKKSVDEQINKIEEEINSLVYELYGLTDEEIKIVEDSLI